MSEQPAKEDSIISLERLLSFHKRSTAYSFVDHSSRRTFSQAQISLKYESTLPEDIIRALWTLLDSIYFRQITQDDLDILNCISKPETDNSISQESSFETMLEDLFKQEYLQMQDKNGLEQQLHRNWKEEMRIHWDFILEDSEHSLSSYRHFQQQREGIRGGTLAEMTRKQQQLFTSISRVQPQAQHPLEPQLTEIILANAKIIDHIMSEINIQANIKHHSLTESAEADLREAEEMNPAIAIAKRQFERKMLLRYFQYEIATMEKKQAAECISKVKNKRETANGSQYELAFEQGMDLEPIWVDESELVQLNKLRETSLFQFYQVGWKSKLNYICHNYLGFSILLTRPEAEMHLLEAPSHMRNAQESNGKISKEVEESFSQMETCHECRLLYHRSILSKCTYIAPEKQNLLLPTFYDPYAYFLLRQDQKVGMMAAELWQNALLSNPYRSGGQRVCGRYFCKMCIKGESSAKCRFCQCVCSCSRCIRSNTIAKFKTMVALLGGDVASLEQHSFLAKICGRKEQENRVEAAREAGEDMTMTSFKMQLEELRLLAHMTMRRQAIKEQLFLNEEAILRERMSSD